MSFERLHHETSKKGNIKDITEKISIIKELSRESNDTELQKYYEGYIQGYLDSINIIQQDKHY